MCMSPLVVCPFPRDWLLVKVDLCGSQDAHRGSASFRLVLLGPIVVKQLFGIEELLIRFAVIVFGGSSSRRLGLRSLIRIVDRDTLRRLVLGLFLGSLSRFTSGLVQAPGRVLHLGVWAPAQVVVAVGVFGLGQGLVSVIAAAEGLGIASPCSVGLSFLVFLVVTLHQPEKDADWNPVLLPVGTSHDGNAASQERACAVLVGLLLFAADSDLSRL